MRDALIVSPLRTPIGKFGGALAALTADQLAATMIRTLVGRLGLPAETLDEVIVAQSYASSEAPCMGRYAALLADLPLEVPGYTLDRRCGSGLQALADAAMQVQSGHADAVLVVGVESMSNIEYYSTDMRWGARAGSVRLHDRLERGRERSQPQERFGYISGMPETAENLARDYAISREDADRFAVRSHQNAAAAWRDGRFAEEVVPIDVPGKRGARTTVSMDEGIREDASLDSLGGLRVLLPDGVCTAGNSSQQNDAAAVCLVVSPDYAARHGLKPLAKLVDWAAAGCDPARMGIGPVPAVARLLQRTGLGLGDMDLIEVNEAFAAQALAVLREWRLEEDDPRVNVNGSGISLGHPIGATGVRIMTTLLHEMQRRGARYGLETMCIGGGQGMAALFERV
ncbi:acetyl-CoA C-acetyltransferase [Pseudomonas mangiferae]|uniref:Acetyl-CoA C-acyltransferase n=1 Tax=Pseudomonas mangiferae TaxID=2593654 RepID=A0A553H4H9_9PSED|nr:acetyl-CoA C-acetyltransferase [Pseudomonas mangiferae]TRX76621.1 acetyl-CoA C-acyltransferase [Pseudomonas mangiferae]